MSKVEVNQVTQQCGTTLTVGGGACKTAVVDATTVTLGRCGGTVSLASGATQSGFGRTGTVDWDTSIQTGTVTAATGKGYFVNTTAGAITVNLPVGVVGSIVAVSDYASTFQTNNLIVSPNGSEKINAVNENYTISTQGIAVTLVYADAVRGWKSVTGSDADATGVVPPEYIAATGGNQSTPSGCIVCTNYKQHTFTGPGTFCVSAGAGPIGVADYLVIAGGGGGGGAINDTVAMGGGGAGGYRESPGTASGCYTVSPLGAAPAVALALTAQGYPIVVGGGGVGGGPGPTVPTSGGLSSFDTITSTGGGNGTSRETGPGITPAGTGGSGGGGSWTTPAANGNTPPTTPPQGNNGGALLCGSVQSGGGGGGATAVGGTAPQNGGVGGAGATSSINATPTARTGGGGGGGGYINNSTVTSGGAGGSGGGGTGGNAKPSTPGCGAAGTINTGSGGGGGGGEAGPAPNASSTGGGGGSGIVIIRYRFQ